MSVNILSTGHIENNFTEFSYNTLFGCLMLFNCTFKIVGIKNQRHLFYNLL